MLFTERSIWTMIHGIGLGGTALMALAAALFALYLMRRSHLRATEGEDVSGSVAALMWFATVALWLTVLVGTYIVFPPYRAAAPEGTTALAQYPRAMLLADPETAWLHTFAMETKEHLPWIVAMLATAAAFTASRYRSEFFRDPRLFRTGAALVAICLVAVAYIALLGVFINKVAPLE